MMMMTLLIKNVFILLLLLVRSSSSCVFARVFFFCRVSSSQRCASRCVYHVFPRGFFKCLFFPRLFRVLYNTLNPKKEGRSLKGQKTFGGDASPKPERSARVLDHHHDQKTSFPRVFLLPRAKTAGFRPFVFVSFSFCSFLCP